MKTIMINIVRNTKRLRKGLFIEIALQNYILRGGWLTLKFDTNYNDKW